MAKTFIDLFSGVGGLRRGLELAGWQCKGFVEWDKFARASYIAMHCITDEQREHLATLPLKQRQKEILKEEYLNGEWSANDICDVRGRDVPRVDLWGFGSPCQSFSISGLRKGLDGESGLIREVFRMLQEIPREDRPEWLIYENVGGGCSPQQRDGIISQYSLKWTPAGTMRNGRLSTQKTMAFPKTV